VQVMGRATGQTCAAREELWSILGDESLSNAPVLVFANKQDLPKALDTRVVADKLDMANMRGRPWHIQGCNAITGDGLDAGMDWLGKAIADARRR
jgi:signal recognition particle receptor subunit beta